MMAEECTHDCSSCGSACASRQKPQSLLAPANAGSRVKKVIGVVSGKGGVGKSLVTGLLACETARRGKIAGVLDADITGPSMPRILGIRDKAVGNELGILPQEAENGVKVMSINLLLEHDTDPVIWRGSLIAGTVKQFWTDVCWGDVDCLYVDMPPGTGDVPLTVFQSLPVDGIVIVTSPQELVQMIVKKALGHPVRTLNLSSVTVLCQNRLPYIRSGKIICKQFVHHCRNGVKNISFRNPFVIKSRRRCNCEIIALIAIPFGVNPVQRKRHDCQYICPDRIFRPGCIDFTGSNIFDIIFIFYIIILCGRIAW